MATAVRPAILRGPNRPDLLRDECLADILATTAGGRPDHPALLWNDRITTYRQLNAAGDAVEAALSRRGATAGQIVGLCLPRGAELLIAQAGITKSGAAWLPLDPEWPLDRIHSCLQSAGAIGLVSNRESLPRLATLAVPAWTIEDLQVEPRVSVARRNARPSDPAYIMFTSGSTGQPKGIVVSQRSICHLLRSENEVLGIRSEDRVYQGFSMAFDMSFEEIWIAYLVGATLWIAPGELTRDPDAIAHALTRHRISVLHAVPTLVGLIDDPLPTVRLINLGGEACPQPLADRLPRSGRRVFNSYGPTETTVTATIAELSAGVPVSIGTPLPNYGVLVVDEQQRPQRMGTVDELCVFGPGLAEGYLGQSELTAERFVANPFAVTPDESRMYRTGDLARIEANASVYWLGRSDHQVKVRGFRIELDEIAAVLQEHPSVSTAAVIVRPVLGGEEIVAFVVGKNGGLPSPSTLRPWLVSRLPNYMIPAHIEVVDGLPRLTSGKLNVEALRGMALTSIGEHTADPVEPRSEDEGALYRVIREICPGRAITHDADFFDDLGGHSLLVARLVSTLRRNPRYATLSVQDVYRARRLTAIALAMRHRATGEAERSDPYRSRPTPLGRAPVPSHCRIWCGLAQAAAAPFFVLLHMLDWLAPFFVYHYFTGDEGDSVPRAALYSLTTFVLARIVLFGVAVAGKWLAAGRLRAGRFPLWGTTYFRWWLGNKFVQLPDVYLLSATPWLPLYLRALGARVGRDVMIGTVTVGAPDLITIEDGVSLGTFVNLENARVDGGMLVLGLVQLKREAVVDSYAVLEEDTSVGERARLCPQSALAAGRHVPDHEIWDGAPARVSRQLDRQMPPRPKVSAIGLWTFAVLSAATALVVSVLFVLPIFPAFMLIDWFDVHTWNVWDSDLGPVSAFGLFLVLAFPASIVFVGLTMLATAGLRWLLPRQTLGLSPVHSLTFWRKRVVTLVLDASLSVLHGLYASVYAPLWLRCLGVVVGRGAEVSTAEGMVPEVLTLGDDTFVGDGAVLGDEEVRGGWMILEPTRVGNRTFIGNGAYVPAGAVVPDDVLIGVQTRAPSNDQLASGQTWLGSPPLQLPAREVTQGFPPSLTYRPTRRRRLGRGTIEALRIVLPLAMIIAAGYVIVRLVMPLAENDEWGTFIAALSLAGCLYGVSSFLFVVVCKWLFVGRYRPRAAPMWTPFVWISEAVTNAYESLAVPNFLDILRGTPMLPWALRLLGAQIGRGVYINTTDLTEFDCVRIGDESELNAWCGPQTHLFEDRVMKIGQVDIGARVTVGARTTILYDTRVGDDVTLGPLTLVAKGEQLPSSTRWEGTPAEPVYP